MFSWYRSQVREYGALTGTRMLVRAARSLAAARLSNRLLPGRVACPCCGWEGRRFYDYIEAGYTVANEACPRCDSHARHRALSLWLREELGARAWQGAALVCAPERALAPLWDAASGVDVCRTDIEAARGVDVISDLQRLPFADASFDLVWCHHVLEQLEDDRAALREIHRVLTASGRLVVSSGVADEEAHTREFGFSDRTLSGNRRQYGRDYTARIAAAGFSVEPIDYQLDETQMRRYGIHSRERAYVCTKKANADAQHGGDDKRDD
jgi:SAM-dependent methyltransferase